MKFHPLPAACLVVLWLIVCVNTAAEQPQEMHARIAQAAASANQVALTLDACSGRFDEALIEFLIDHQIPATIFATKKWLDGNPRGVALLRRHLDLFEIEDHGENHIPAVLGIGRKVYGIPGEPDLLHLRREVLVGADAAAAVSGVPSQWYRGATGEYDQRAADEIRSLGMKIAGFSVNADAGATLSASAVVERMRQVQAGDVILAHMNKPESSTAEGLAPGLLELLRRGFVFVRLDQVNLQTVP